MTLLRHRRRLRRRAQRADHRPRSWRSAPDRQVFVATKMGRRVDQDPPRTTTCGNFRGLDRPVAPRTSAWTRLDLVQLHCPPDARLLLATRCSTPWTRWSRTERIAAYGVSVETCDRGDDGDRPAATWRGADHPQPFRHEAAGTTYCPQRRGGRGRDHRAGSAGVGAAVRPVHPQDTVSPDDHRTYNRHGESFDRRDVLRGGLRHRRRGGREFAALVGAGPSVHPGAGGAALDHPAAGVTTVIPGARSAEQARANAAAAGVPALSATTCSRAIADLYDRRDPRAGARPLVDAAPRPLRVRHSRPPVAVRRRLRPATRVRAGRAPGRCRPARLRRTRPARSARSRRARPPRCRPTAPASRRAGSANRRRTPWGRWASPTA